MKNVVATANRDDNFDWQLGSDIKVQYGVIRQTVANLDTASSNGFEGDNNETDNTFETHHHPSRMPRRLDTAIEQAVEQAPENIRAVVAALQGLRGVRKVTAVGVVAEIGQFSRFPQPSQLMGYSGAVPTEFSTGGPGNHRRGAITKAGNAHLRRLLGEAAWCYRFRPAVRYPLKKRQQGLPAEVIETSWKAQVRLCNRYRRMVARGKLKPKVVIAIARELLGFMWAIGVEVEKQHSQTRAAA